MRTDRAATRMTSDRVAMRLIVDRRTHVKTLPSLVVSNNFLNFHITYHIVTVMIHTGVILVLQAQKC